MTREGVLGQVKEWNLLDCISVHKSLETDFNDPDAASRKLKFDFLFSFNKLVVAWLVPSGYFFIKATEITD
jgi:hypothetical protein